MGREQLEVRKTTENSADDSSSPRGSTKVAQERRAIQH